MFCVLWLPFMAQLMFVSINSIIHKKKEFQLINNYSLFFLFLLYTAIDSIEGEAYEILDSVIPVIQTDASEFGQLVQQFNDASSKQKKNFFLPHSLN